MNLRFLLPTLMLILIASGCASTPAESPESAEANGAAALPFEYECDSGTVIQAAYPTTETARVKVEDTVVEMDLAVSADGARYMGDEFTWWTKGSGAGAEGTLFANNENGETGEIIEKCVQTNVVAPQSA